MKRASKGLKREIIFQVSTPISLTIQIRWRPRSYEKNRIRVGQLDDSLFIVRCSWCLGKLCIWPWQLKSIHKRLVGTGKHGSKSICEFWACGRIELHGPMVVVYASPSNGFGKDHEHLKE